MSELSHSLRTGFGTYCGLNVHGLDVIHLSRGIVKTTCQDCINHPEFKIEYDKVKEQHLSLGIINEI